MKYINKLKSNFYLSTTTRTFLIEFLFTYGIVITTAFFQCVLYQGVLDEAKVWEIMIDALAPTTITFSGLIIIQRVKVLTNSFKALVLYIALFALCSGYTAYSVVAEKYLISMRVILIFLALISLACSKAIFALQIGPEKHKAERSDAKLC